MSCSVQRDNLTQGSPSPPRSKALDVSLGFGTVPARARNDISYPRSQESDESSYSHLRSLSSFFFFFFLPFSIHFSKQNMVAIPRSAPCESYILLDFQSGYLLRTYIHSVDGPLLGRRLSLLDDLLLRTRRPSVSWFKDIVG